MITLHCKHKGMYVRISYKNVIKTSYQDIIIHLKTRYVDHAKDPGKPTLLLLLRKILPQRKMSFMSTPTTL